MGTIASQITSLTIVYSTVYSDADERKHQSSASLAFVWGIHRGPGTSPHKWPITRKMFPFDDVIMYVQKAVQYWACECKSRTAGRFLSHKASNTERVLSRDVASLKWPDDVYAWWKFSCVNRNCTDNTMFWSPGAAKRQSISSHVIDLYLLDHSTLSTGSIMFWAFVFLYVATDSYAHRIVVKTFLLLSVVL